MSTCGGNLGSLVLRGLWAGGAYLGIRMLNDQKNFTQGYSNLSVNHMVEEDYVNHLLHSIPDYSGNDTITNMKHRILNPSNFHFITRPYARIKHTLGMLWDNIIPIGLLTVGTTYALGGSLLGNNGVFTWAGRALRTVGSAAGRAGRSIFGAFWDVFGNSLRRVPGAIASNWTRCLPTTSRGILSLAALGGLAVYAASLFARDISGINRENAFNFLNPPGGH